MVVARAGSKELIRQINEALVLDVVRDLGPVARGAIAARTGLSPATVTGIAGRMIELGMLVESDVHQGARGRPARLLELGDDAFVVAGARVATDHVDVVLVSLRGEVVVSHREPLGSTDPSDVARAVARAVAAVSDGRSSSLFGVGVAVSGVVDHARGRVRHSGSLGWEDVPLRDELDHALGRSTTLDSYVNCLAQRLLLFDRSRNGRDLLVVNVGISLGASIVVQGAIHRGFDGAVGGLAHSRLPGGGPSRRCHCGAVDCLETRASRWGIEQELERRGLPLDPSSDGAAAIVEDAVNHLALGVANVAKVLGPERVVLAVTPDMDLPQLTDGLAAAVGREYVHHNAPAPQVTVELADHLALATGAAYVSLARLFTPSGAVGTVRRPGLPVAG
ncbi:hypothetical protein GCM10009809_13480 [Isoptericola hypogeus]|uniref:NBD/HSP70 family sugar kinase n=1 Tax=Isoptericola hypogeus TaxID=300179 RepID=A0ABN2J6D3_9MICO